jgi:hypothetical protein
LFGRLIDSNCQTARKPKLIQLEKAEGKEDSGKKVSYTLTPNKPFAGWSSVQDEGRDRGSAGA